MIYRSLVIILLDLLSDKLSADEILIDAVKSEQRTVVASLLDLTMLHDNDLVGITDSAQSVGNDYNGLLSAADQQIKSLLNLMLTLSI